MQAEAIAWAAARKNLLEGLSDSDSYLKAGKGGTCEVVQPLPVSLTKLWNDLSTAEWNLYNAVQAQMKENPNG